MGEPHTDQLHTAPTPAQPKATTSHRTLLTMVLVGLQLRAHSVSLNATLPTAHHAHLPRPMAGACIAPGGGVSLTQPKGSWLAAALPWMLIPRGWSWVCPCVTGGMTLRLLAARDLAPGLTAQSYKVQGLSAEPHSLQHCKLS